MMDLKKYLKEYRLSLRAKHLCIECRKQDAHTLAGYTLCYSCAMKSGERATAYYYKNREKVRARQLEYQRKKREERVK